MKLKLKILTSFLLAFCSLQAQTQIKGPKAERYTWKNVQISGGGFVSGIVFHPTEKNLRYCRTDMGGAYRWDKKAKRWQPLLDWVSYKDANLMGVESIAVDPSNPSRVYFACGTYTRSKGPNAILRSDDQGKTFKRFDVGFKMGGNENGRGNGERLSVDPFNGNILFMGTRLDGLWKSVNRGETWFKVSGFPDVTELNPPVVSPLNRRVARGSGVVFTVFDESKTDGFKSSVLYAGCSLLGRENIFKSTDGGETWSAVPGQPINYRPNHAVLAKDGMLYITYGSNAGPDRMVDGAVWKFNTKTGEWKDITPDKPDPEKERAFGYAAVSVDMNNPQTLIVSSFGRYSSLAGGEDIFRSTDGGDTWKSAIVGNSKYNYSLAPYVKHTGIHWLFDIEIDPFNSDHALFTTGYGGHETFNLNIVDKGLPVTWQVMSTGIEETVALDLLSPSKGAQVITAIGDYGGFVHSDLTKPVPEGNFINPHFSHTDGLAYATKKPDLILRVGEPSTQVGGGSLGYSLNGGKTWKPSPTMPTAESKRGYICVSANGDTWIWTPSGKGVYATKDQGLNWVLIKNLPNNIKVIADPVNSQKFYAMNLIEGKLFTSTDGGKSFSESLLNLPSGAPIKGQNRGDNRGGQDRLYATPDKENDLWLAAFDGLYHSGKLDQSFKKMESVSEIHAFGFGKAASGSIQPTLFLVGIVNTVRGIFRSDNFAKSWVRINDDNHQWGLILHITGDPKKYGRVYVGTHGRGVIYGDIK